MLKTLSPENIAVLRLSALGDCINAYGLIGAIRQAYPDAHTTFIVDRRFSSIFGQSGTCSICAPDFRREGLASLCWLRQQLKNEVFDVLLDMQTSIKASMCSMFIKSPIKIGYDSARSREGQRLFVDTTVKPARDQHVMSGFLEFAKAIGIDNPRPSWDFGLGEEELQRARGLFKGGKKVFALSPASAKEYKNWNAEGYARACEYLHERDFEVALIGDSSQACTQLCQGIRDRLGFEVTDLAGKTSLRELLAVIKCADLMLSPDSGPMHIASAVGTPVVGLFAIHSERRVGPYNFMDLCVSVYDQCAKEELGEREVPWRYRVRNEQAMGRISFEDVKIQIDKALSQYIIKG